MNTELARLLQRTKKDDLPDTSAEDGTLVICCRTCRYAPRPASDECLGCMVKCMSSAGGSDRIVLRTGMDTEISGRSGQALRKIASL